MFRPEILAPAGNLFKLKTAVRYGADAVYIAGRDFGLRSAADNFTCDEIQRGCRFAHDHGAKLYVVLNAFLFDDALSRLPAFLAELEVACVDAVIVSDLGVLETVRNHSNLAIHLSTQSSTLNTSAARFWKSRGVSRLVLGREVSIEEAGSIKREADVEVEVFIHGAMCMAFSGNCSISNYTAGRDANRGGCVQSCRFRYTLASERAGTGLSGHFLSSKDLQGVTLLDQFVMAKIDCVKIEGRMKSALYVATASRAYAAARDAAMGLADLNSAALLEELNSMSHRDYSTANLQNKAGSDSVYRSNDRAMAHSHDMVGHVVEVKQREYIAILLKNPLVAGRPVLMLAPSGGMIRLATSPMRNLMGAPLLLGNPNQVVLLPFHPDAEKNLILSMPKHVEVPSLSPV